MATKTFTDFSLRRGDADNAKRWGGKILTDTGTPVRDLQTALAAVGVYDVAIDGDFGGQTHSAVQRFQWNLRTVKFRIVKDALHARTPPTGAAIPFNGIADTATAQELKTWVVDQAVTTGNLPRANLASFPKLEDKFKTIDNPSVKNGELVIDADFVSGLQKLDDAAAGANVTILVNQAFRVAGAPVGGAVVKPATKSQHLIGHAIDCNIQDGATLVTSAIFAANKQPANTRAFVNAAKAAGLRWGGDFTERDYVHFDDFVDPNGPEFEMRYFFNQRTISKRQP